MIIGEVVYRGYNVSAVPDNREGWGSRIFVNFIKLSNIMAQPLSYNGNIGQCLIIGEVWEVKSKSSFVFQPGWLAHVHPESIAKYISSIL